MDKQYNEEKRPHGVTGDTVEQAAEVSVPTASGGRVLDNSLVPQEPRDPKTSGAAIPGRRSGA